MFFFDGYSNPYSLRSTCLQEPSTVEPVVLWWILESGHAWTWDPADGRRSEATPTNTARSRHAGADRAMRRTAGHARVPGRRRGRRVNRGRPGRGGLFPEPRLSG